MPAPEKIARLKLRLRGVDAEALAEGVRVHIGSEALPDKALVNSIKLTSVSTDSDVPLDVSLGLFENADGEAIGPSQLQIDNKQGWIESEHDVPTEFATLASLHPCETARYSDNTVYQPLSALSSRYVNQYGHLSAAKLKESIVSLPGEDKFYLIDSKSTISNVIESNWYADAAASAASASARDTNIFSFVVCVCACVSQGAVGPQCAAGGAAGQLLPVSRCCR